LYPKLHTTSSNDLPYSVGMQHKSIAGRNAGSFLSRTPAICQAQATPAKPCYDSICYVGCASPIYFPFSTSASATWQQWTSNVPAKASCKSLHLIIKFALCCFQSATSPGYRPPPPLPSAATPPPAAGQNSALSQPPLPPAPAHGRPPSIHYTESTNPPITGHAYRISMHTPRPPPPLAPAPSSTQHPAYIPSRPTQPWMPPIVHQPVPQQPATISPPPPQYLHTQPPHPAPQPPLMVPTPIPDLMDADDSQLPASPTPPRVTAPPRPPNPELIALHARLHEMFTTELASLTTSVAQENERLRGAQADLLKGEPAVRDEMARLEAVRGVCQTVCHQLAEVVNSAENAIANLERKGEPEIDELVCATSIVHNQYVRTVHRCLKL
jgi:hypothetical protein